MNSEMETQAEKHPHLKNAPINEAIVEILFSLPEETSLEDVAKFEDVIKDSFPEKRTLTQVEGKIESNIDNPIQVERQDYGFVYFSDDKVRSMQTRINGFSFSISRQNYSTWDDFIKEARSYFDSFSSKVHVESTQRISLRYINQIDLPIPFESFTEFFHTRIEIASGLPQSLANLYVQLTLPNEELGALAIITQTVNNPTQETVPFIFDIDVQKYQDFSNNVDEMWSTFNRLRDFKNEIFFKSITEKTKKMLI